MIKIVYTIATDKKTEEVQWLRDQKIYPSVTDSIDLNTYKPITYIGIIVSPEAALAVKLKHKLNLQIEYRRK